MKKIIIAALITAVSVASSSQLAIAESTQITKTYEPSAIMRSITLTEDRQQYIAKKDANSRVGPNTAFDTAGMVHSGDIIQSIGRARSWVAFEQGDDVVFIWDGLLNKWETWPSSTIDATE